MIAKKLVTEYKLKQTQAAELLRVSQPAISHYNRKTRGKAIDLKNDEDVEKQVEDIARSLAGGRPTREDLIQKYCKICRTIRSKGVVCKLHKALDQTTDTEACELCLSDKTANCV
jgi:predicted transcriptional regulator